MYMYIHVGNAITKLTCKIALSPIIHVCVLNNEQQEFNTSIQLFTIKL